MSSDHLEINFQESNGKFSSWKTCLGQKLFFGTPVLTYKVNNSTRTVRATLVGTVIELASLKENEELQKGMFLVRLSPCEHTQVMKDMCADCGENLRVKDGMPGERLVQSEACVAMVHSIPELTITREEAKQIGAADEENILSQRKLVLLVDLDQTLIHTTNEEVEPTLKDVFHFQLYGRNTSWYHVKFRPNTRQFLDSMRSMYEMHICTFGARMYAHKIADLLDPDKTIFGHRILSRDECFDSEKKTANLKALFPNGDRLVCIIDDREDVWNFESNVIAVKPYRFFKNTGDINAPSGFTKTERNTDKHYEFAHPIDKKSSPPADSQPTGGDKKSKAETKPKKKKTVVVLEETEDEQVLGEVEEEEDDDTEDENESENKRRSDDDDYLHYLEEILRRVHTAFYQLYDQTPKTDRPPDLHSVIPYVKLKVLKNVNLVFSAVIPTNVKPEESLIYNLAKNFGANIQENIVVANQDDSAVAAIAATTHLVAGKLGTNKVKMAQSCKNVKIVSPQWLWCCVERWERVDERLFPLYAEDDYTKVYCNLEGNVYKNAGKRFVKPDSDIIPKDVGSKSVQTFLDDENVSTEVAPTSEVPLGKRKPEDLLNDDDFVTKRCRTDDENGSGNLPNPTDFVQEKNTETKDSSSSSDSDTNSMGSFDDEMAAALEREFSTDQEPEHPDKADI